VKSFTFGRSDDQAGTAPIAGGFETYVQVGHRSSDDQESADGTALPVATSVTVSSAGPVFLAPDPDAVPAELRARPQWVGWRYEERNGETTKGPIDAKCGKHARVNDPATWSTFEQALAAVERYRLSGVGYVFSLDDLYCGADLDKCRDPDTGGISETAHHIKCALASYTELSASGEGVHTIVKARKPGDRCRAVHRGQKIELYDHGRWFAMSGAIERGGNLAIEERQKEIDALYASLFPPDAPPKPKSSGHARISASLAEILAKAQSAKNGDKFARLWRGDWSGYPSQSEADLALCRILAYWTGNVDQVDRLFRQSGLYRQKWDEVHHSDRQTYGEHTVRKALRDG
jgi:primase-polymerase (primpol)-like protein